MNYKHAEFIYLAKYIQPTGTLHSTPNAGKLGEKDSKIVKLEGTTRHILLGAADFPLMTSA